MPNPQARQTLVAQDSLFRIFRAHLQFWRALLHLPADDMTITQKLNTTTKPHQMLIECHILKYSSYDNNNDNLSRQGSDLYVPKPV
jgi:hypothetical protein